MGDSGEHATWRSVDLGPVSLGAIAAVDRAPEGQRIVVDKLGEDCIVALNGGRQVGPAPHLDGLHLFAYPEIDGAAALNVAIRGNDGGRGVCFEYQPLSAGGGEGLARGTKRLSCESRWRKRDQRQKDQSTAHQQNLGREWGEFKAIGTSRQAIQVIYG